MKILGVSALVVCAVLFVPGAARADHQVNINTADSGALMTLAGIGEVKAEAIIDYRNTNGPFGSKEEIQEVNGIGPSTYENIKDHIVVSGGSSNPSPSPTPSLTPSSSTQKPSPSLSTSPGALSIDAGGDRAVVSGADVEFTVRAYRDKKELGKGTNFLWNFGDGSTGRGSVISHHFEYPGRYAVIVEVHSEGQSAFDRFTITAEQADLLVFVGGDGGLGIENRRVRDVDLSKWIIRSNGNTFMFPEHSIVLSGQSIRLSPSTLGFTAIADAQLAYPDGALAFTAGAGSEESSSQTSLSGEAEEPLVSVHAPKNNEMTIEPSSFSEENTGMEESKLSSSSQVAAAASVSSSWGWWIAAGAIALGAGAAAYVAKRLSRREWNIVEDTEG